jgi:hypothetical protein
VSGTVSVRSGDAVGNSAAAGDVLLAAGASTSNVDTSPAGRLEAAGGAHSSGEGGGVSLVSGVGARESGPLSLATGPSPGSSGGGSLTTGKSGAPNGQSGALSIATGKAEGTSGSILIAAGAGGYQGGSAAMVAGSSAGGGGVGGAALVAGGEGLGDLSIGGAATLAGGNALLGTGGNVLVVSGSAGPMLRSGEASVLSAPNSGGDSGNVLISSGAVDGLVPKQSNSYSSGAVSIFSGDSTTQTTGPGTAGAVDVRAGYSAAGPGASVSVTGGRAAKPQDEGTFVSGGALLLSGGAADAGSSGGAVSLIGGSSDSLSLIHI